MYTLYIAVENVISTLESKTSTGERHLNVWVNVHVTVKYLLDFIIMHQGFIQGLGGTGWERGILPLKIH